MLKIYGNKFSFFANKVLFLANYLSLDYEFIEMNLMKGEQKSEEHLARHPFGKIPAIEDNGQSFFESNTIMRYLAQKSNSELYPTDLVERAEVDQWLDFISIHLANAVGRVAFNRLFAKNNPNMTYDEKSVEFGLEMMDKYLPVIEARLADPANKGHIANAKPSLAGFALLGTLEPFNAAEIDLSKYPTITKWREDLRAQEWYQKVYKSFESYAAEKMKAMAAA